jgi:Flp pilus assembly protein TadG
MIGRQGTEQRSGDGAGSPAGARPAVAVGRTRQRGQSLVEFSLVIPLFLLMIAGIVDFGMLLYTNMTAINAAREGARLSVTYPGDASAVEARVRAMATGLNQADLTVTTSCVHPDPLPATTFSACSAPMWQSGDAVVVNVHYVYHLIWPLMFGDAIPLTSSVTMRIE